VDFNVRPLEKATAIGRGSYRRVERPSPSRAATLPAPEAIFAGIPCLELAESVAKYAQAHGVPYVADIQDIWPEVYMSILPRVVRPLGRTVLRSEFARARRILRGASSVTAVSKQYLDWAATLRGDVRPNDRVFYLGYRLPPAALLESARRAGPDFLTRLRLPSDRLLVTFLGQFGTSYDIDTIARTARLLETRDSRVHFILAGAGDKLARVRESTKDLRSVTLTGWLEYQDTITLLQQSHVGLAAYAHSAPQSLPYKPFEYMAFGLPIISSLNGELRSLIKSHSLGEYYEAGNPQSLATAIQALATDDSRRATASENARALYVREFDTEVLTNKLITHLESLVRAAR
jgi:glycosyltransferase involved in cell wall biosynthesis